MNANKEERPLNPIKDILIFEQQLNKKYMHETKRRFMYFVVLMVSTCAYIMYIINEMYSALWDIHSEESIPLSALVLRIYCRVVGVMLLLGYIFIRLMRRSTRITNSLTAQLKLLNIYFKNQKLNLCTIKAPKNIKTAINIFREEEQRKKAQWLRRE